ncbi:MAG: alanine racemase [Lachnospiraceae bacterium]|nr:alanine racemase [Lachnospiraceae bacterium]
MESKRCYAKISLDAIYSNLMNVRAIMPEGAKLLTVVKANAYGHGSRAVASYVEQITDLFGVACIGEAVELRETGITKPILILGYTSPEDYEEMIRNGITAAIYSAEDAEKLSEYAKALRMTAHVHIAVDTGMTRIGFRSNEGSADEIRIISKLPNISIDGMFTHLSCADMEGSEASGYTEKQLDEFDALIAMLDERNVDIPLKHAFNSAATMMYKDRGYNGVRSGIVTYGLYPSSEVEKERLPLKPALSWYAKVVNVASVEEGRGVSYGATYTTKEGITKIATVCAGYADGYPRALSGKGRVIIRGEYAPIIGRVCMDQFMVDVSHIRDVQKEDPVVLIGRSGELEISADEIAALDGTINYEVVCRLSPRVRRVY